MTAEKLFRAILAVDLFVMIILFTSGFFTPVDANEEIEARTEGIIFKNLNQLVDSLPDSMRIMFLVVVFGLLILLTLAALVIYAGLFLFWNWARFANLFSWGIYIAITPFLGWSVIPPWEVALAELSTLLGGIILAASFLPPIDSRFKGPNKLCSSTLPG